MVVSMERWVGKVAVVSGAAFGIGAAIATKLVENGLQVVGLDINIELLEQNAKKLSNLKGKLHPVKTDMTIEDEVLKAFRWTIQTLGPIHILVNNAGTKQSTNLVDGNTKLWRYTLDLNFLAYCIATREAIKSMRANNIAGHIVHINSISGHSVQNVPNVNVYPASKHAVTALTETLRQELNSLGSKIKVTSVSPGAVATGLTVLAKGLSPQNKAFLETLQYLQPEDVAEGVIYALSTPSHVQVHELTIRPVGETL